MGCFHSRIAFWMFSPNRKDAQRNRKKLLRMGISTALAITIHNFPEGLAGMVAGTTGDRWEIPIVLFFFVWRCLKRSQNRNFSLGVVVIPQNRFLETTSSKEKFVLFFQSSMEPQKFSTETRCASESHLKTLSSKKNTT